MGLGGILILFYFAGMGLLFAGAGLVDLVLLPVPAADAGDVLRRGVCRHGNQAQQPAPVRVGHYVIQPPAPGDWYRIAVLEGAAQSPMVDQESAPYRGAGSCSSGTPRSEGHLPSRSWPIPESCLPPEGHVPGAPPQGRTSRPLSSGWTAGAAEGTS